MQIISLGPGDASITPSIDREPNTFRAPVTSLDGNGVSIRSEQLAAFTRTSTQLLDSGDSAAKTKVAKLLLSVEGRKVGI